jgi:glycosyltransferase involved in cell wall biosynthesis
MAPAVEHKRPTISVVIPTHNRAQRLAGAIASTLQSPLVQPERVIVVDDDSTDETEEVAHSKGVTYLHGIFRGPSGARNAGFAATTSEYITFLDDDDEWLPHNMEAQLAALEQHPEAGFAFGLAETATEDMRPTGWTWPSPPLAEAPDSLHVGYPQLGAVLFRRDAVEEAGGFDTRIRYQQDADLMLRIAARHEIVGLEVVGVLYRDRYPGKTRSDYYWSMRSVTNWWPKAVGWRARVRFIYLIRRMFVLRFLEDASASAEIGQPSDALVSLGRATFISPPHVLRHVFDMIRTVQHAAAQAERLRTFTVEPTDEQIASTSRESRVLIRRNN